MSEATNVLIRFAEVSDSAALAQLLARNRVHFRSGEPARADRYYTTEHQRELILQAADDRDAGRAVMFVIERAGTIAGRINLNSIIRGAFQSASVGYVVDRDLWGQGTATDALRQVIAYTFGELNLHRLQAETLTTNAASQRVLTRCGFCRYGQAPEYLKIDGRWQTNDLFQLINADYHAA